MAAPSKYTSCAEAAEMRDEELLAQIEKRKKSGNEHYARGDLNASMQSWLSAIWLLKLDRPTYPEYLSTQMAPTDVKAAKLLGRGRGGVVPPPVLRPPVEAAVSAPAGFLGLGIPGGMVSMGAIGTTAAADVGGGAAAAAAAVAHALKN